MGNWLSSEPHTDNLHPHERTLKNLVKQVTALSNFKIISSLRIPSGVTATLVRI